MNLAIKKFIPLFSLMASLLLYGCNGGVSANAVNDNTIDYSPVAADLVFDQFGQIPKAGANKKISIGLHNTTSKKLALNSIRVINPLTGRLDNTLATIDSSECIMLTKMAGCNLGVTSHLSHSGSFLLEAEFNDVNGLSHAASQLIRYNERIEATNGLAFENDFHELTTADGNYRLALPVVITEAFDNLTVTNGDLACDNGYQAGSSCTYFANGKINGANELIGLKLAAFRGGQEIASKTSSIYTTITNAGNLLITQPADLHIAKDTLESATSVTLYNSGNAPVSNMTIRAEGKLSYQAGDCGAILAAQQSCTLTVSVNSEFDGSDILNIDYQRTTDGANRGHLAVNVYYMKKDSKVGIQMRIHAGNLVNTQVFTNATQDIVVRNSGVATLENLIYQLYPVDKSFSLTPVDLDTNIKGCSNKLVANQECGLRISFAPQQEMVSALLYKLNLNANYHTSSGEKLTVMTGHQEPYSARISNVAINVSKRQIMMGDGVFDFTAILNNGQTHLDLTSPDGDLSKSFCGLDAWAQSTCHFQLTSYRGNPNSTWDPDNVANSDDPDKPTIINLPLALSATTTNAVLVNGTKSPATIKESLDVVIPYIYLPATGITTSFVDGDDGATRAGIEITSNGRFSIINNDCEIIDNLTGLIWLRDLSPENIGDRTYWSDASSKVKAGSWCDQRAGTWRMPNINELRSLINYGEADQVVWLNKVGFINVYPDIYWSSTTHLVSGGGLVYFEFVVDMEQSIIIKLPLKKLQEGVSRARLFPVRGGK